VSDGFVYVGSSDDNIYCLNAATGAKVWEYTTGDSVVSSPAVSDGFVYVGSMDDKVYCLKELNAADGDTGSWPMFGYNPERTGSDLNLSIYDITSNHGPDGANIPLEYLQTFTSPDEVIQWIAEDADAAPESGEWSEWTLGIANSYVSYWTEGMSAYSPETELTLNDSAAGYYGRWKWISPVLYLPGDGWYSIKLIAEDMYCNRSESEHTIKVDTSAVDLDSDGIPDSSDNCPDNCNSQQLDADGDGIGDVCDQPDDGCDGCGFGTICEVEC
jgi:hypothetical protein